MDSSALLTDQERRRFACDGYLLVRGALHEPRLGRLRTIADAHDAAYRQARGITEHHVLNEHDLIGKEPEWLDLIDLPATFPKVWAILGWNIQLFHTQLLVTPPAPAGAEAGPYGWHQDNNRMNRDLDTELHPMISLKVGYFLTDLPTAGMGNLTVLPGSHRLPIIDRGDAPPNGVEPVEIHADAGDAVIFDRRLWHSASTNTSSTTRVFVAFGYAYRWLRPKSTMPDRETIAALEPIRRQLLGWATTPNGYYDPLPEDVPLKQLVENASSQT